MSVLIFKDLSALQINTEILQLRVLDNLQQLLTYIFETTANALSEDRPQHRDHHPALFDK